MGLIPGSGTSAGEGSGNPLQYSCLENPMDKGARWATIHSVGKSQTRLKQLSMYAHMQYPGLGPEMSAFLKFRERERVCVCACTCVLGHV